MGPSNRSLSRRQFIAAGGSLAGSLWAAGGGGAQTPPSRLGIGASSYGHRHRYDRETSAARPIDNPLYFLEHSQVLGAGGIQAGLSSLERGDLRRLRHNAERYGMFVEGSVSLPRDQVDLSRFQDDVRAAKIAGATVVRTAMLSGRRYETFDSAEAFRDFAKQAWTSLTLAEPTLRKRQVKLAVENHKDLRIGEMIELMRRISSEFVGICVDTGNNIALFEDPVTLAEAFAPHAFSVHLKDMAVEEKEDGFLLAEMPLGAGALDLPRIVTVLREAQPALDFSLEMITRDPLEIPCLTEPFWATMPAVPGADLARTLAWVRKNKPAQPLPRIAQLSAEELVRVEEENVRKSLAYAHQHLGL